MLCNTNINIKPNYLMVGIDKTTGEPRIKNTFLIPGSPVTVK